MNSTTKTDLNIFRTMKPESTSKTALFETDPQTLLPFIFHVFLNHKRDMRLTLTHLDLPSCKKTLENKCF